MNNVPDGYATPPHAQPALWLHGAPVAQPQAVNELDFAQFFLNAHEGHAPATPEPIEAPEALNLNDAAAGLFGAPQHHGVAGNLNNIAVQLFQDLPPENNWEAQHPAQNPEAGHVTPPPGIHFMNFHVPNPAPPQGQVPNPYGDFFNHFDVNGPAE